MKWLADGLLSQINLLKFEKPTFTPSPKEMAHKRIVPLMIIFASVFTLVLCFLKLLEKNLPIPNPTTVSIVII